MHYLKLSEIENISLDHTSKCNLLCPQCARTNNDILPVDELTIDDYKSIILPVVDNLKSILYCGNFGDAIASNTFLPAISWLYKDSGYKGIVNVITNGSLRDTNWWSTLANIIGKRGSVIFSIDGLADTNHIYRVNSSFKKIINNATAYIKAGGIAHWDYLVFGHNEEQIDKAKELARELGFSTFKIKQTNRFMSKAYAETDKKTFNILNNTTSSNGLKITNLKQYQGTVKSSLKQVLDEYGSWNNYANKCSINCKAKNEGRFFVDFEARVWACTWTAGGIYYSDPDDKQRRNVEDILNKYGKNFNSLRHYSLEEILNHEYYSEKICDSWNKTITDTNPKLEVCVRFCGDALETSSGWQKTDYKTGNKNNEVINLK